jgi:hypothetical protein
MVYVGNNKTIIFGGTRGPEITLSDVWEYDIESNEWTEKEKNDIHPKGRYGHCMAFDGVDKVVIYAGVTRDRNTVINDTWEYDINTHIWTEYCTEDDDIKPGPNRFWSAMTYGGEEGKVIMFSGNIEGADQEKNDLWEYDTNTHTWTEIIVEGDKPSPRMSHNIVYISNKIVLFGGWDFEQSPYMDDTWEFDLETQTWQEIYTNDNPSGRHMYSMAKLNNTTLLLFGGETYENARNNDTWEYNIETKEWIEYTNKIKPDARVLTSMCYGGNDNVILFAGLDPLGPGETLKFGDLWEYRRENE